MARYQVALVEWPQGWEPASMDDVPCERGQLLEVIAEAEALFPAVRQAIQYNEAARREPAGRWAVVVEPGTLGCTWRNARLCTPLTYKVAAIWWPGGWEPQSPLDVPNCMWRAQGGTDDRRLSYLQAVAVVRGLNQQSMAHGAAMWYVVLAVENEPLSQTVSYDPAGTETTVAVRRLHVVRPEEGGSRGDCSHCPAQSLECARAEMPAIEERAFSSASRGLGG